ncbi:hypothetical protein HYPSUDRAFT_204605 [Hypholoma sublateritium FD-334 SS-4]|uniref:Uncharacterized protein n=1 Tax=Hypholoma sublateritium (strain FD-334 SS-4) TaxID=945553 RepID=A0A0D2M7Z3_HYPSF|nr:hypothetical protein HYPSUDRAFT_204605 [Hypholoma sublateritium FD-334 SS-4]
MTSINNLPVELLDMIFHYAATNGSECYNFPGCVLQLPKIPDKNLFPLNVSAVCTLWLQILKSHPRLWRLVVIDVASNPVPFLDTLDLFVDDHARPLFPHMPHTYDLFKDKSDAPLILIVFSSDPSIDRHLENSRTRLVFKHLVPVIHRYERIIFRLIYQSSLPSAVDILFPNPSQNLRELCLTSTISDLSDNVIGADDDAPSLGPTIPTNLRKLSLTGIDFVRLFLTGWLQIQQQFHFQLSITHYKLRRRRDFTALIEFLRNISHSNTREMYILLSDISFEHRPSAEITSKCTLPIQKMWFSNVSADFISAFFSAVTFANHSLHFACFENCVIPRVGRWNQNITAIDNFGLELVDIDQDDSLYNALEAFPASDVRIIRCKGVTDQFLRRLSGDNFADLVANRLEILSLVDCTHFTAQAACTLLVNRHRRIQNDAERSGTRYCKTLAGLYVIGEGPAFHADHVPILEEGNLHGGVLHKASVSWNVECSDSHAPGCMTDLHPIRPGRAQYPKRTWGFD